jgi:hypothetical protein
MIKGPDVLKNPTLLKPQMPRWARVLIAAGTGGALVLAGDEAATRLKKDSPVHFSVEGSPPEVATDWSCAPEGGIVGAPVVCRYVGKDTGVKKPAADAEVVTPQ